MVGGYVQTRVFLVHEVDFSIFFIPCNKQSFKRGNIDLQYNIICFHRTGFINGKGHLLMSAYTTSSVCIFVLLTALRDHFR